MLISRDLYTQAPTALLDNTLHQAEAHSNLSPADRVFGWVKGNGRGQYKGQLRIGSVRCLEWTAAIERVGGQDGIPLAILGAPKPAQSRFYAAKGSQGTPYEKGKPKKETYREGHGLRGRKVYVHQRQAELPDYWQNHTGAVAAKLNGKTTVYREWKNPASGNAARTDQNRSVTAWVKPATRFQFDIDIANLSKVELGALLWLLNQPEDHRFRLGGGKPLGFGAAHLKITGLDLRDGHAIKADYVGFGDTACEGGRVGDIAAAEEIIDAYRRALPSAVGNPGEPFDRLRIVKAYLNAAKGGIQPVHYPRVQEAPDPEGKNFEWFVRNEKLVKGSLPNGYSLPDLERDDRGLPVL